MDEVLFKACYYSYFGYVNQFAEVITDISITNKCDILTFCIIRGGRNRNNLDESTGVQVSIDSCNTYFSQPGGTSENNIFNYPT
jgi:hypothetical protein